MEVRVNWKDGKLDQVSVHDATGSHVHDIRGGGSGSIAIRVYDKDENVIIYLRPAVARELFESLSRMFPVDEPSEEVGFPSEIKPVAGLERGSG